MYAENPAMQMITHDSVFPLGFQNQKLKFSLSATLSMKSCFIETHQISLWFHGVHHLW